MKISQFSKITALLSTLCVVTAQAQLSLKIDRDLTVNGTSIIPVMPIDGRVQYDIASNEVRIQTEYPVICNRASDSYVPISNVKVRVTDPNGKNKGDEIGGTQMLLGVQSNVAYDLSAKAVEMITESRSKGMCVSADGLDLIFKDHFAEEDNPPLVSDVTYVLNNQPLNGYAPGENVDYYTEYQNLTGLSQLIDFIEYYPTEDNNAVYFSGISSLGCGILDGNDTVVGSCTLSEGAVKNVTLLPNHKIRLSASRVLSTGSQVGADLIMMSAVFAKVNTIDGGSQDLDSLGGSTSHAFAGFDKQVLRLTIVAPN